MLGRMSTVLSRVNKLGRGFNKAQANRLGMFVIANKDRAQARFSVNGGKPAQTSMIRNGGNSAKKPAAASVKRKYGHSYKQVKRRKPVKSKKDVKKKRSASKTGNSHKRKLSVKKNKKKKNAKSSAVREKKSAREVIGRRRADHRKIASVL